LQLNCSARRTPRARHPPDSEQLTSHQTPVMARETAPSSRPSSKMLSRAWVWPSQSPLAIITRNPANLLRKYAFGCTAFLSLQPFDGYKQDKATGSPGQARQEALSPSPAKLSCCLLGPSVTLPTTFPLLFRVKLARQTQHSAKPNPLWLLNPSPIHLKKKNPSPIHSS
jgi:hypothetical protein